MLPALALASLEVGTWERVTLILGLTLVCSVHIAIGFPPVRFVYFVLGFLPVRCALGALGFAPVCYEVETRRPLVASFLLVLAKTKL